MTMLTGTRPRHAETGDIWLVHGGQIERALGAAIAHIDAVPTGGLVSLTLVLPPLADEPCSVRGDTCWLGRDRALSMHGSGVACRFDDDVENRFLTACADWRVLGADDVPPLAWYSVPSATEMPRPSVWVPRVMVRVEPERTVVTFSARRDVTPAADVSRHWLSELRGMVRPAAARPRASAPLLSTVSLPDADTWRSRVRAATAAITDGQLAKVVLARRLSISLGRPVAPSELAEQLASLHPGCYVLSFPHGRGSVVAASPELLAAKRGRHFDSHALAGTARRHDRYGDNAHAASALMRSAKERHEHAVVVDTIAARMATFCDEVDHPKTPAVLPLRFVQHLWTPVSGRLKPRVGLLDAVSRLHPTPAVLGSPMEAARDWLANIGERRDGLYTGIAGWIDADGDGDGVVVLRSAYVEDSKAILWAGAGIVADSDPDAELAETELKLATMLEVLRAT